MKIFFIFLVTVFSLNNYAQNRFIPGFIITNNFDTISGYVANNRFSINSLHCNFKNELGASSKEYFPSDIFGYQFNDGKYYISKKVYFNDTTANVFLEFIIKGKVNFYYLRRGDDDIYFVQKENDSIVFLDNRDIYYRYDEFQRKWVISEEKTIQKVSQSNKYKGTLNYILSETPNLQKQVKSLSLDHNSVIKLAKEYHYAVCDTEDCIVFEKNIKPWRAFGISFGYVFNDYVNNNQLVKESFKFNQLNYPGLYFITQTRSINENTQFKAELFFNRIDFQIVESRYGCEVKGTGITLPLTWQYTFSLKKVKPYLNGGIVFNYLLNAESYKLFTSGGEIVRREFSSELTNEYKEVSIGGVISTGILYPLNRFIIDGGADYMLYFNSNSSSFRLKVGIGYLF